MVIDGYVIKGEEQRGRGVNVNAATGTDPTIMNTCMFDPVGGSVSFYDTVVQLIQTWSAPAARGPASHEESMFIVGRNGRIAMLRSSEALGIAG
jgi:hypothetical protein